MRKNWQHGVAYLLTLIAAGILLLAAFFKAGDPELFAQEITAHRLTPESWSAFLAYAFIAGELALGAALVAFVLPRVTLLLNVLLMLGFIFATAWAWAHGNVQDCGCFGRLIERGPREVIIQDAVVIGASLAAFFLARGARTRPRQWSFFALLLLPVLVLIGFGTALPIDGPVTGVRPGTDLSDMAASGLPQGVDEGRLLLALVDRDCPACDAGVESLKAFAALGTGVRVAAVCPGTALEAQRWRLQHLPNFPTGYAPPRVLRQYYRRLPVTFLLEDGIVRRVWWNRIPSASEIQADP
ncbi:MAG: hypothetical protein FJY75_09220 [Candidatus Eisenbacteria bacterium]|uniref:Methylamine utilisation protein MauE domain-containing protein n=1 Tax=Eiseniibacteriota bacterium TaxID=2212470 RepID=A0A938BP66_UNCEI|nr:hypothetical protein [Candidatus Eisenbacteria bacterium]